MQDAEALLDWRKGAFYNEVMQWRFGKHGKGGQAMTEYVVVLVAILSLAGLLSLMLYAARSHAYRTSELVSSDYP